MERGANHAAHEGVTSAEVHDAEEGRRLEIERISAIFEIV